MTEFSGKPGNHCSYHPDSTKKIVLVVDDTPENIDVLTGVLRDHYRVKAARSGVLALKVAATEPKPDIILLDIMMPEMDGYQVCEILKKDPSTQNIPVIFITAKSSPEDEERGLELGAVDYITKPISPPIVIARVKSQLAISIQNRELQKTIDERTRQLQEVRLEIIRRLGRAAEFKDNETGLHVIRMSIYARLIAEEVSDNEEWIKLIFNAAPMHDIGKIGIPDNILLKPESLNDSEWEVMKKHPEYGVNIIGEHPSKIIQMAREMAICHHEKWDGSGYPRGLKGKEIPLSGRIIAIADVFDALTTGRPYKQPWPVEDAIDYIENEAGKHFDPELVPLLHKILPEILRVKAQYAEETADSKSQP